jgi:hypothetical protein
VIVFHKHLNRTDGFFIQKFKRDRFGGFGFGIAHQSGYIGQPQALMLDAAKTVMKPLMELNKLLSHRFDIVFIKTQVSDQLPAILILAYRLRQLTKFFLIFDV